MKLFPFSGNYRGATQSEKATRLKESGFFIPVRIFITKLVSEWPFLCVLGLTAFLTACGPSTRDDGPEVVNPLPEREELVAVLVDVQLAEAALKSYKPETRDSLSLVYYERIAQLHGVSREELLAWLERVNDDPRLMEEVYKEVLEELNRQDALEYSE